MPKVNQHRFRAFCWVIGIFLAGIFLAWLVAGNGAALAQNPEALLQRPQPQRLPPVLSAKQYFLNHMFPNLKYDNYLQRLRREFTSADSDGDGQITEADTVLPAQVAAATIRGMLFAALFHFDLDGDGVITEDEIRRTLTYERNTGHMFPMFGATMVDPIETQVRKLMAADTDHDGNITVAEALAYVKSQPDNGLTAALLGNNVHQLIALAPDGKQALTLPDFEAAATAAFQAVDTDGDGVISAEELKAARSDNSGAAAATRPPVASAPGQTQAQPQAQAQPQPQPQAQPQAQALQQQRRAELEARREEARRTAEAERAKKDAELRAACPMPKASDAAAVVLIGAREAEALSSTTIGSQDVAVGVGTVTVEPGTSSIYLVLVSFDPTIWRFYGAVERIERVVVTSARAAPVKALPREAPLAGATGVPAERITFLGSIKCLDIFTSVPSIQASQTAAAVEAAAGKAPAAIAGRYSLSDVAVPSAKSTSLKAEGQRLTIISQSAGTLNILGDTKNIVVQAGPGSPETELKRFYPGGVIQIDPRRVTASAAVEPYDVLPRQAGLAQLQKAGRIEQNRDGEFLIKEKIRFPAELTGSVKFLLLRGVPQPDGDPGQAQVISEETGKPVKFDAANR